MASESAGHTHPSDSDIQPAALDDPIQLPSEPQPRPPGPFPVLASLAPVVVSLVMWSVTRSPYVLVFAALGPVVAIAGLVDGKLGARRRLRRDEKRYAAELVEIARVIDERHRLEREQRRRDAPSARSIVGKEPPYAPTARWRAQAAQRTVVVAGSGALRSRVTVIGEVTKRDRELMSRASRVDGVPLEVDVAAGIGLAGPLPIARAGARGILLQLCERTPPGALFVTVPDEHWSWAASLPHTSRCDVEPDLSVTVLEGGVPTASGPVIAVAEHVGRLPPSCRTVVDVSPAGTATVHHGHDSEPSVVDLDPITELEAALFARDLSAHADELGIGTRSRGLPRTVPYRELEQHGTGGRGRTPGLEATIGVHEDGTVATLDLVTDGPHAIVGGTTGSGKSELLITWATSIAERCSPEETTLLLVDFKGGAAFAPLLVLPHVVGVITDLDQSEADRALHSLRAELRARERTLRELGVRDITGAVGHLARLVIVVDEFAAMLDGFPDLFELFVDIAARGRSLGVHLILCTQRPNGVVRESLLANCGLRMSLRVNNRADSAAVVGTDLAARLPGTVPGRLVTTTRDGGVATVQVATVAEEDLERIADRWRGQHSPVRRPWIDPLPDLVRSGDLRELHDASPGVPFGIVDLPEEQRRSIARYDPDRDGSLLVLGSARSGKTAFLETVAAAAAPEHEILRLGGDAEALWDALHALRDDSPNERRESLVVLIDDLDGTCSGLDEDYALAIRELIVDLLRSGPRRGIHLVLAVHRLSGILSPIAAFVRSTLVLRLTSKQEHTMAGADATSWVQDRRAGNGVWRGHEVQIVHDHAGTPAAMQNADALAPIYDPLRHDVSLIVSRHPSRLVGQIRASIGEAASVIGLGDRSAQHERLTVDDITSSRTPSILVGDPEQWQSHWSLFASLRPASQQLYIGCSAGEFRAITRVRELPPLLDGNGMRGWHVSPDQTVRRVRLEQR